MRISPINQQSTNFNGKFRNSEFLNESLARASNSDLKRFGSLLKRMKAQNDNLVFSVEPSIIKFNEYCKGLYITLEQFNEKLSSKRDFNVGYETAELEEDFSYYIFKNVIKEINAKLEKIYPKQETATAEREKFLGKIYKNLD